ncbi:hypothetical protein BJY01DRAFT_248696 [Aspergillus pseudoustus]|uniref:Transcription factor domain-containing protein n=1 Tax=Aspergillus pseudoustus TaxID=1810923 RepID=A0ABR4JTE5_9EURO
MARPRDEERDRDHQASCFRSPTLGTLRQFPARPLSTETELTHMEYFHLICAKEFALYFELPIWEMLILQQTLREPALHHAALAIACLTRTRYHPVTISSASTSTDPSTALSFSINQYGLAIRALHTQLTGDSGSVHNLELAALASVVFTLIEFLLGIDSQVEVHLRAGYAVLKDLGRHDVGSGRAGISMSAVAGDSNSASGDQMDSSSYGLLANAILQLTTQVESFRGFRQARL